MNIEEYGQDKVIYSRMKDPELYEGQHIATMKVLACQCRIMIEQEKWSTGNKTMNNLVIKEIEDIKPEQNMIIRYAYDESDPTSLAILRIEYDTDKK